MRFLFTFQMRMVNLRQYYIFIKFNRLFCTAGTHGKGEY
jgi:hypothetical protein